MEKLGLHAKLYFGVQSLNQLDEIQNKKVWIICDKFLAESGSVNQLTKRLDASNQVEIWSDVVPDPPIEKISAGIQLLDSLKPEIVLAFGGGSAIDTAKAVIYFSKQLFHNAIEKFIAIPTTSGTGSEVTSATVISDPAKQIKYPLFNDELLPDEAILDPELVISVPPAVTANTGMDVLTHALESYVSVASNDFTEALAEKAGKIVNEYLLKCYQNGSDIESRMKMHNASCMAGLAFNKTNLGITHSIAHQLGAVFHIPHGLANAILLNHVIRFNASQSDCVKGKYAKFARALGLICWRESDEAAVLALQKRISWMMSKMKMPSSLSALDIRKEDVFASLEKITFNVFQDACFGTNPVQPSASQVISIICEAL